MKKLLFILVLILIPVFISAQENANQQLTFFITTVQLDSANAKSVKVLFQRNPSTITTFSSSQLSISSPNGNIWTPGFYRIWTRGDTTAAGNDIGETDSLSVTLYEIMYDGSRGARIATTVVENIDWTVDTWEGPFRILLFGPSFGLEAVLQKTCTGSADTSAQTIMIIYYFSIKGAIL